MTLRADLLDGNLRHMEGRSRFRPVLRVLIPYSASRISKNYENDRFTV